MSTYMSIETKFRLVKAAVSLMMLTGVAIWSSLVGFALGVIFFSVGKVVVTWLT